MSDTAVPARRRSGALSERVPAWGEPMVEEFDELFERMSRFLESAAAMPSIVGRTAWAPAADMYETDDAYVVEAEFPGVSREKIDVEISDRELVVKAEIAERAREGVMRRSTRRAGTFEYRAMLPADVKTEGVGAQLSDGVLTVTVPQGAACQFPSHRGHREAMTDFPPVRAASPGPTGPSGIAPPGVDRPSDRHGRLRVANPGRRA